MVFGLFGRKKRSNNERIVLGLYEALTSAARQPVLYAEMGVPDTVMGRFEMLAAHVILFLRRVRQGPESVAELGQAIVDEFFLDIDHSIRELGVGDVGVPKKMKKFARMFYGRADSYGRAIDAGDRTALADALKRNIHPQKPESAPDMRSLAEYMLQAEAALAAVADDDLLRGRLAFPAPAPTALSGASA
jgi:cytochrome b pre-mRNA-processing protein 3